MAMQQELQLEVPTIYNLKLEALCKGISLQSMTLYATVPLF